MQITKSAESVYDSIFKTISLKTNFLEREHSPIVEELLEKYFTYNSGKCLDIGTGAGRQISAISKHFQQTYAYDISLNALEISKAKYSNKQGIKIYQDDMITMSKTKDLGITNLDCVISISVINHTTHSNIRKVYKNIYNTLKVGGIFIYTMISKNNPAYNPSQMVKPNGINEDDTFLPLTGIDGNVIHHFSSKNEIIKDLNMANFKVIEQFEDTTGEMIGGRSPGHLIIVAQKHI